jgi:hypothetical protein
MAAEVAGDLAPPVQRHVDAEVEGHERAVRPDDGLGRVALEEPPRAARVPDRGRVVVAHDRPDVGDRREDALVAAREAGHEVRLDESEHDAAVGLDVFAAEEHRPPEPVPAHRHERRGVVGGVVHDAVLR